MCVSIYGLSHPIFSPHQIIFQNQTNHTKQIIIEQGGVFNGHCKMGDNLNPVMPKVNETESAK